MRFFGSSKAALPVEPVEKEPSCSLYCNAPLGYARRAIGIVRSPSGVRTRTSTMVPNSADCLLVAHTGDEGWRPRRPLIEGHLPPPTIIALPHTPGGNSPKPPFP